MKLQQAFEQCRRRGESALITYFPGGYPTVEASLDTAAAMEAAGADIIELGVPFSDPVADGPVIQAAAQQALDNGATLRSLLEGLSGRAFSVPICLMSYLNPILAYGPDFYGDAAGAGVAGLIIPDLPVDEAAPFSDAAEQAGLDLVLLAAPTSPPDRLEAIAEASRGFVYTVARAGITGRSTRDFSQVRPLVDQLRDAGELPVAVGFGVSDADGAAGLTSFADGVIVGTRLIEAYNQDEDLTALVRSLKRAMKKEAA